MQPWRFIPLLEASGDVQMSIDRWLLHQHRQAGHPPTLRFYLWSPVAISLGYHQRHYPPAWADLTWQGEKIALVRRPTGGRGVLHQGDLTYSIVTSGLEGNLYQAYQTLCTFLIEGWQRLGITLYYGRAGKQYQHHPNCFGLATAADLVAEGGNKLIGSAQMRQGDAILQHGSMLLDVNADLFAQVFGVLPPPPVHFAFDVASPAGRQRIVQALSAAAQDCFKMELLEQPLSPQEWEQIKDFSH